jgi:hypothetical protein
MKAIEFIIIYVLDLNIERDIYIMYTKNVLKRQDSIHV